MSTKFDEFDYESWYFGPITGEESRNILKNQRTGVFLVRNSSCGDGYVICVKEKTEVKQYKIKVNEQKEDGKIVRRYHIRDELSFADVPALLSFYKLNKFETTPLTSPAIKDQSQKDKNPDLHFEDLFGHQANLRSDHTLSVPNLHYTGKLTGSSSSTYDKNMRPKSDPLADGKAIYVKVKKKKDLSAYISRKSMLNVEIGDVIKVIQMNPDGLWLGELNGVKGIFQAVHTVRCDDIDLPSDEKG